MKEVLFLSCLVISSIFIVVTFYTNNLTTTALLLMIFVLSWKFLDEKDKYVFVVGAIIGPVIEIIAIYFGVWRYANPTLLGIPMWLPVLYGIASIFIERIARKLISRKGIILK